MLDRVKSNKQQSILNKTDENAILSDSNCISNEFDDLVYVGRNLPKRYDMID